MTTPVRRCAVLALFMAAAGAVDLRVVDPELERVVAPTATLERLVTGLQFIEGPVWSDADGGFLVFSDIPANELKRWSAAGGLSVFRAPSERANGNLRMPDGHLISCEHAARRVTRTAADGTIEVLADRYQGKKLNSPNDAALGPDGALWFTDPPYGIKPDEQEQPKRFVFRLDPGATEPVAVADDFDCPNGICFSPDGQRLYIADSGAPHHVRVFTVRDNALVDGAVFAVIAPGVPDGMRCDADGRLWVTAGDGVQVFAPDGRLLGAILVPESPANCCFGGADGKRLFITARTSLYAIDTLVAGAVLPSP